MSDDANEDPDQVEGVGVQQFDLKLVGTQVIIIVAHETAEEARAMFMAIDQMIQTTGDAVLHLKALRKTMPS